MGILRAPLCIWLLIANGLSISSGLQDVKYIPLGGSLKLPIDGKPTKEVLLKTVHSGKEDVVAEWDWGSAKGEVYGKYKNRTELDKETGVTINNMTIEDSGEYYMVFDSVRNSKIYMVEVITATPRNEDEGNTPVGSIVGGIIGALILAVCLMLGVKYRDHIKDRLSCGSKPVVDPESEVPLQEKKESTPVKNNLDSADEVPLQEKKESTPVKNNLDSADAAATAGASSLKNKNGVIDAILSRVTSLNRLCDEVKGNKNQCQRLVQRVKGLKELVLTIKEKGPGQNSADVEKDLSELNTTLESAEELVQKYTSESFHEHVFKDYDSNGIVLRNLNATFKALSQNLQVEHKVSEETSWQAEDEADREKDHAELKRIMDLVDAIVFRATSLYTLCEEVKANKKQFQHLVQRVKGLEELVLTIKQKGAGQNSGDVEKDLSDLNSNLEYAVAFVTKYTSDSFHVYLFEDYHSKGIVLQKLNHRLYGPFKALSQNLQVELIVSKETWQAEDEADREKDHAELKRIMDLIDDIFLRANSFISLCENAKGNKEECEPLKQQVKQLQNLVEEIKQNGAGQNSADVEKALCEVKETLPSAEKIVEQYTDGALMHMGGGSKDKLKKCKEPLSEAFNVLSQALQL